MNTINILILMFFSFSFTFFITFLVRKILISTNILVAPNKRSSHVKPIPQGGGLAIYISFIFFLLFSYYTHIVDKPIIFSLAFSSSLIVLVGLIDDFGKINASIRLLFQFLAASLGLYLLSTVPTINVFSYQIDLGWLSYLFFVFYLVWFINLFNFMDGINGIASFEAICLFLFMSILSFFLLSDSNLFILFCFLGSSVLGFVLWNFPKSYIILGDVGSTFLGLVVGLSSIFLTILEPHLFWVFLILAGVFLVDSTYTLVQRIINGDKFYEAHSVHAYQKITRKLNSHSKVTSGVILVNLFWLFPIASIVAFGFLEGIVGLVLAYVPLLLVTYFFKAGVSN